MRLYAVVVLVGCGGHGQHPGDAVDLTDGPCAGCTSELPFPGVALATTTTLFTIRPKLCSSVDRNCFEVDAWDKQTMALSLRCIGDQVAGDDQGIAVQAKIAYGSPQWGPVVTACNPGGGQIMAWGGIPFRMPFLVTAGGGHAFIADNGNILECPLSACPSPTVLAPGAQQPAGADANGLYLCGTTLTVIPLTGSPTAIFTSSEPVVACAYSADRIWFATATTIASCPKSPTPCTPKVATTGAFAIDGLHADATNVYWLDHGNVMSCGVDGCTLQTKRTTCNVASPAPDQLPLFNGDADNLYCAEAGGKTLQIPK